MTRRSWLIAPIFAGLCVFLSPPAFAGTGVEEVKHEFRKQNSGDSPIAIREGKNETFWVIARGASGACGKLYRYTAQDGFKVYSQLSQENGCNPISLLVLDGLLIDDTVAVTLANGTIVEFDIDAKTQNIITASHALGAVAQASLKPSKGASTSATRSKTAGHLYITTSTGIGGAIYESTIRANGALSTPALIFTFPSGYAPNVPAVVGPDGALYGVTQNGGTETPVNCQPANFVNGCGIVYRVRPVENGKHTVWQEDVLRVFQGGKDGSEPNSTLAFDADGNVYGTTLLGGDLTGTSAANCEGPLLHVVYGCGVVYMLSNSATVPWKEAELHLFHDNGDGAEPFGPVMLDANGNVYGTTIAGGKLTEPNCLSSAQRGQAPGCGVVFELTEGDNAQWSESVLYAFKGKKDGGQPTGPLAFDSSGNIYGTTWAGGNQSSACFVGNGLGWALGCGVFYEVKAAPSANSLDSKISNVHGNASALRVRNFRGDFMTRSAICTLPGSVSAVASLQTKLHMENFILDEATVTRRAPFGRCSALAFKSGAAI